jgi:hypothetical protein
MKKEQLITLIAVIAVSIIAFLFIKINLLEGEVNELKKVKNEADTTSVKVMPKDTTKAVPVVVIEKPNTTDNTEIEIIPTPKEETAKAKLAKANAKKRSELIEYSKGLCGNKVDNAKRYKVEVDNNTVGFTKKEKDELVEKFQLIHDLLTAERNLRQEPQVDTSGSIRRLETVGKNKTKLTTEQLDFYDKAKGKYCASCD